MTVRQAASDQVRPVFDFSPIQIVIVLAIALIALGPRRLPEMGRSLGRGLREFRGSVTGRHDDEVPEGTPAAPTLTVVEPPAEQRPEPEPVDPAGLAGPGPAA
jgi:sec-independent protein translocase protein TatA